MDLAVSLGPLRLKNPIIAASGAFGGGDEFQTFFDLKQLGALVAKTLTVEPRAGNAPPRLVETPSGMLNAVGLQNVGIEEFFKAKWPALRALGCPIIVSIAGFSAEEFAGLATRATVDGVAALELNLSCPNVAHGEGARCFAQSAEDTRHVIERVKASTPLPVIAKLSPEVSDLPSIARAAESAGADILSLVNTMPGMVIDIDSEKPVLANKTGGLSGPALRPVAVRCVWEARRAVKLPIIGLGGVVSGRDALEMILAGADAVAIGTASFWDPKATLTILKELTGLVERKGRPLEQLRGAAQN